MPLEDPANQPTHRLSPRPNPSPPDAGLTKPSDPGATPLPRGGGNRLRGAPIVPGYELLRELGRGGMGVVYLAVQQALRRTVALKMLLSEEPATTLDSARFFTEAEAVAAIKHPHVVQIYDFSLGDSCPFMAMEYLPGGSLSVKLAHQERLMCAVDAARLVEKLARAMQAAHEQGIVHRDLKPGNVLFDEAGEPRVTDFGIAKRVTSDLTKTMEIIGTPGYMAPEQASGRTKYAGPAADIYALGAILYECLTGKAPFEQISSDPWPILHSVIHDPPTRPGLLVKVPHDLELICLRCLEKAPQDRYTTAATLADDLLRFVNRQPVSVRPPGVIERGVKWARRRPTAALAYALAAVVFSLFAIGAVIVAFWMKALDSKQRTESVNQELHEQMKMTAEARTQAEQRESEATLARRQAELLKGQAEKALSGETIAREELIKVQRELIKTKYYNDVAHAQRERDAGNVMRADQLLNGCPQELRGWEWWHCRAAAHPELASFTLPDCIDFTYSPDGEQLIVANTFSQMEYRKANTGELVQKVAITYRATQGRWLSANGQRLLIADLDQKYDRKPLPEDRSKIGVAGVWDSATGQHIVRWKDLNGSFFSCSVNADGSIGVITGNNGSSRAQAYDLKTGKLLSELPDLSAGMASSLTADGKLALSTTEDANRYISRTLWETKTAKVVQRFNHIHDKYPTMMMQPQVSPDGSHIVFFSVKGDVGFWKVGETTAFRFLTGVHVGSDFRLAFSPDGSLCATAGGEGGFRLWKTSTGEPLGVIHGHQGKIQKLLFHPKQNRLISMEQGGACKLWRIAGNQAVSQFELPVEIPGAWQWPVAVNDRADKMFVPCLFPDLVNAMLFDRNGQKKIHVPRPEFLGDRVFQPGGNLLAFATFPAPSAVELRDATTGKLRRKIDTSSTVKHLMFSADGTRLMGAIAFKEIAVWEVATGKQLFKIESALVGASAISGDGKRVVCAAQTGSIWVCDVASGATLCRLNVPGNVTTNAVASNHDGSRVAIGSNDWKVRLFDLPAQFDLPIHKTESGRFDPSAKRIDPSAELVAHTAAVQALTFSATGDRLVSGSDDGCIKVWDPQMRVEAIELRMAQKVSVHRLFFSHDGTRLIAIGRSGGATIFDGAGRRE